jgi:hypothetical protein
LSVAKDAYSSSTKLFGKVGGKVFSLPFSSGKASNDVLQLNLKQKNKTLLVLYASCLGDHEMVVGSITDIYIFAWDAGGVKEFQLRKVERVKKKTTTWDLFVFDCVVRK